MLPLQHTIQRHMVARFERKEKTDEHSERGHHVVHGQYNTSRIVSTRHPIGSKSTRSGAEIHRPIMGGMSSHRGTSLRRVRFSSLGTITCRQKHLHLSTRKVPSNLMQNLEGVSGMVFTTTKPPFTLVYRTMQPSTRKKGTRACAINSTHNTETCTSNGRLCSEPVYCAQNNNPSAMKSGLAPKQEFNLSRRKQDERVNRLHATHTQDIFLARLWHCIAPAF